MTEDIPICPECKVEMKERIDWFECSCGTWKLKEKSRSNKEESDNVITTNWDENVIVHADMSQVKPIRTIDGVRADELLADMERLQEDISKVIGHLRVMCGVDE